MSRSLCTRCAVLVLVGLAALESQAALPAFDFTKAADRQGWMAAHDIGSLQASAEGLVVNISGADPYLTGPPRDYPAATPLWLRLRLKSERGSSCQVFYYNTTPTEERSVHFHVPAGQWVEGRLAVPALGPGCRLRIDPPNITGVCTLASLRFDERGALPEFDLATLPDANDWVAQHDISSLEYNVEGLRVYISGGDPYLAGPPRDFPANTPLWLRLRLKSDQGGMGQVFYYRTGPTEAESVRFEVPAGQWFETKARLPALGPGYRFRIDPPGNQGLCLLGTLRFEERVAFPAPAWPAPVAPTVSVADPAIESGDLRLIHRRDMLGGFAVEVAGKRMAVGHTGALLGYAAGKQARWLNLGNAPGSQTTAQLDENGLLVSARVTDPDGARWDIQQFFSPGALAGSIDIETRVTADTDRDVLYLPMFTLLPGLGSWGTNKTQALLAGVEYLENEPSSSEADLTGPAAQRQVPDTVKLTLPLMAIAAEGRYLGLTWEPSPSVCAVFDSPDRLFGSAGHLLGLLFPGSDGLSREESSLLPYGAELARANQPIVLRATLLGGQGQSVVPAVQQYVQLRGLPPLPSPGLSAQDYFVLAARGWLDSKIRQGDLFRHAAWPSFGLTPAADAALYLDWLAGQLTDTNLAARAAESASAALAQVQPASYNSAQVGHVRYPAPALVYGAVAENAAKALAQGRSLLGRFEADGSVHYHAPADGLDYGKTHWAPDANGLTAGVVASLLEAAAFSGNRGLITDGLRYLRALDKFRDSVPRGAQTWEIPLHTPDILASAYLVRAYTLGYELAGDPDFLAEARYWAWTGVPFVYLTPPAPQPVGLYNTIPVLGATAWAAPVWIGLPVQWCGLVYADALHRFARHDPAGPWKQIADGIAVAGIQHTYPVSDTDYLGLLPDSYNLRAQSRNGPAINPATVLAPALRALGQAPIYEFRAFSRHGLLVHAPGKITDVEERADGVKFTVSGWSKRPYWVMVNGLGQMPRLKIDGQEAPLTSPHQYRAAEGRLILQLRGQAVVEVLSPAQAALDIQRLSPGAAVKITWPAAATNFALQARTGWAAASGWFDVPALVRTEGARKYVIESAAGSQQFYRLQKGF